MPKVNVLYKLTVDATVDPGYVKFEGVKADLVNDKKSANLYEGKVKGVFVTSLLDTEMLLGGFAGLWALEVKVKIVDAAGQEVGVERPLVLSPFKDNTDVKNYLVGLFEIKWT